MAHAQKPDFVFRRNGRVRLNRWGRQFSRLPAAEVCASAVVMLHTPSSEVEWRVLATHSIRQFPLHFPSRASPRAITFQLESKTKEMCYTLQPTVSGAVIQQRTPIYKRLALNKNATFIYQEIIPFVLRPSHTHNLYCRPSSYFTNIRGAYEWDVNSACYKYKEWCWTVCAARVHAVKLRQTHS